MRVSAIMTKKLMKNLFRNVIQSMIAGNKMETNTQEAMINVDNMNLALLLRWISN